MAFDDRTPCILDERGARIATPLEWERALGLPDDWTLVPYRGKPASDGPRYAAIGKSWAVNVARWIGRRIEMVEDIKREVAA
jgi:DNA (cytosine-5)-methyltransferase 1